MSTKPLTAEEEAAIRRDYERAQEKWRDWFHGRRVLKLANHGTALLAEVEELRKVLRWYAEQVSWAVESAKLTTEIYEDAGQRAWDALEEEDPRKRIREGAENRDYD